MNNHNESASKQTVRWGPVDNKPVGIVVAGTSGESFVPWDELQVEVEQLLLPQVRVVPQGSTAYLADLGDRKNWIVQVLSPAGEELGHVWFGPDPDTKWKWDGLVRLGSVPKPDDDASPVWQIFERYSDGSYRRIEARRID